MPVDGVPVLIGVIVIVVGIDIHELPATVQGPGFVTSMLIGVTARCPKGIGWLAKDDRNPIVSRVERRFNVRSGWSFGKLRWGKEIAVQRLWVILRWV